MSTSTYSGPRCCVTTELTWMVPVHMHTTQPFNVRVMAAKSLLRGGRAPRHTYDAPQGGSAARAANLLQRNQEKHPPGQSYYRLCSLLRTRAAQLVGDDVAQQTPALAVGTLWHVGLAVVARHTLGALALELGQRGRQRAIELLPVLRQR